MAPQEEAQLFYIYSIVKVRAPTAADIYYLNSLKKIKSNFFANFVQIEYSEHIEHIGIKQAREEVSDVLR